MPADDPHQPPGGGEGKSRDARAERLAAALRENLRKRKNQARVRRQGASEGARSEITDEARNLHRPARDESGQDS